MVGGEDALTAGVKQKTWEDWQRPGGKGVPAYRIIEILQQRAEAAVRAGPGAGTEEKAQEPPAHMRHANRAVRTWTVLYKCLTLLEEKVSDPTTAPDYARRRLEAWEMLVALRPMIERLAGWDDAMWRDLLDGDTDYWRRPPHHREPEEKMMRKALDR